MVCCFGFVFVLGWLVGCVGGFCGSFSFVCVMDVGCCCCCCVIYVGVW